MRKAVRVSFILHLLPALKCFEDLKIWRQIAHSRMPQDTYMQAFQIRLPQAVSCCPCCVQHARRFVSHVIRVHMLACLLFG